MKKAIVKGRHRIDVRDLKGRVSVVDLDIQYEQIIVHPPIGKKDRYQALPLTIIYAKERGSSKGRKSRAIGEFNCGILRS